MNCTKKLFVTLFALGSSFMFSATYAAFSTPVGYWKINDEVTGKPKTIIQIWQTEDRVLMGKIVKVFSVADANKPKLCTACQGERHNQPIVGMVIISGLKANQNQWDDGEILDPQNGKTYSCNMRLANSGKQLDVHGYIGLPLLGRSQTWDRIDLSS